MTDTSHTTDNINVVPLIEPQKEPKKQVSDWDAECKAPEGSGFGCCKQLPAPFCYSEHLSYWTVHEDATQFWTLYGKKIAIKNLIISIGNLLLAFTVWLIWSVVSVLLLNAWEDTCLDPSIKECYYAFTSWSDTMDDQDEYKSTLWLLPATAGLSGATLRLTNSFMIASSGGRIVISQTSIIMLISISLVAAALNNTNVSMEYLIVLALLTGAGGGAFASSMSNISFFFPKSKQGLALGLNAGIGNLGVSVMQILVPGIVSYAAFGSSASMNVNGIYIANSAIIWIPFLLICLIGAWFFMNSLPQHKAAANIPMSLTSFYWLELLGFIGSALAVVILIYTRDYMTIPGLDIVFAFTLWFIAVVITVICMKFLIFCNFLKEVHDNIEKTMVVLKMQHTWLMTFLYIMSFGSFIGFSTSFPMLIKELYPNKSPLRYAWLGPFVGSIVRPIGGYLSDKYGGATVTHWDVLVMIATTISVGITVVHGQGKDELFPFFLTLFLLLFITTGIGNASIFRMIPQIFKNKDHAGPVLGWCSAIAAYGAFVMPMIFKASIAVEIAEWSFFGFAFYYFTCLLVNWFFYYRKCWCRDCKVLERGYA